MLVGGEGESGAAPQPPAVADKKETKEDRVREVSGRRRDWRGAEREIFC